MKGLYCRAGVSDAEPKFVIQETVSFCVVFRCFTVQVDANHLLYIEHAMQFDIRSVKAKHFCSLICMRHYSSSCRRHCCCVVTCCRDGTCPAASWKKLKNFFFKPTTLKWKWKITWHFPHQSLVSIIISVIISLVVMVWCVLHCLQDWLTNSLLSSGIKCIHNVPYYLSLCVCLFIKTIRFVLLKSLCVQLMLTCLTVCLPVTIDDGANPVSLFLYFSEWLFVSTCFPPESSRGFRQPSGQGSG